MMLFWPILGHFWCSIVTLVTVNSNLSNFKKNTESLIWFLSEHVVESIFNRPGVAGAVLQSASLLIHSLSQPFLPNLQNIINHKKEKLGSWNFEEMFTSPNMSLVTCHVSCVMCHVSHVTWHMSHVMGHLSHFTNANSNNKKSWSGHKHTDRHHNF
jgi:hypothetical protein